MYVFPLTASQFTLYRRPSVRMLWQVKKEVGAARWLEGMESRTGGRKTGRGRTLTHRAELRDVFSSVSLSRLIQDSEAGRTGDWIRTLFCPLRFGVSRGGHIMRTMHMRGELR